ncbi:aconitase X swivel domain-containing protein, partial [Desulfocurvus sp. DL9XJH121]
MLMKGRVINSGKVTAEAVVMDSAFSFIGEFDPDRGVLVREGDPLNGCSLAGKVLVCTTGKGGTIAPFIAYRAKQVGKAPAAIL